MNPGNRVILGDFQGDLWRIRVTRDRQLPWNVVAYADAVYDLDENKVLKDRYGERNPGSIDLIRMKLWLDNQTPEALPALFFNYTDHQLYLEHFGEITSCTKYT